MPIQELSTIQYKYIFKDATGYEIVEWGDDRIIDLKQVNAKKVTLIDTWNHAGQIGNAFFSKTFPGSFIKE